MAAVKNTGALVTKTVAMSALTSYRGMGGGPTDLHHEASKFKWVVVHGDAAGVANDGGKASEEHAVGEEPGLPAEAEVEVDGGGHDVDGHEGDVDGQGRTISVGADLHGTDVQGTVCLGAEDDHVKGRVGGSGR